MAGPPGLWRRDSPKEFSRKRSVDGTQANHQSLKHTAVQFRRGLLIPVGGPAGQRGGQAPVTEGRTLPEGARGGALVWAGGVGHFRHPPPLLDTPLRT